MKDISTRVCEIVADKLDFPWRYPPLPEITADTELAERWFGPVDRATVQMALDEEFGFEIPCAEAASWTDVASIIALIEARRGETGTGSIGTTRAGSAPNPRIS